MEHCVAGQGRNCFLRLLSASRLASHSAATLVSTIAEARTNSQLCVTCNFQAEGLGSSDLPGTYGNVGRNNGCVRGEEIVTLGASELAIPRRDFQSAQSHQLQHPASVESQAAMGEPLLDGLKRGLQPGEEKVIEFWKLHGKQTQQRDKHEGSQAHPEVQPQLAWLCIGDSA